MKQSVFCRCILCLLLSVVLLPFPTVRAEDTDMRLITVNAENLFDDRFHLTELLLAGDQYYIRPEEAGELAGLKLDTSLPGMVYRGQYQDLLVSVAPYNIESVSYHGDWYYELEPFMEQLQVYLCERDGILYFNSVQGNFDSLLVELNNIILSSRFDADYLRALPGLGDLAYGLAKMYQAIDGFDFNVIANYEEDIQSLLMELVSPDESDLGTVLRTMLLEKIQSANKKLNKAAKYILKAEDKYEDLVEFLYEIPKGGSTLLFGVEGTQYLRDGLEVVQVANKEFLSDFFLRNYFSYAEMSDYKEAMKELDQKKLNLDVVGPELNMYSLSDLISLTKYYADVMALDESYIRALDNVLKVRILPSETDPVGLTHRTVIYEEADQLVNDYKLHIKGNLATIFGSLAEHFSEAVVENVAEDLLLDLDIWTRLEVKAGVSLFTFLLDRRFDTQTTKKMDAIVKMYEYKHIQDMIYDSLKKNMAEPKPEEAEQYIDAAILYLKCAWYAIDAFSYSNLPKDGIPTNTMKKTIEENLAAILGFASFEFQTAEPERIPGGSLSDQDAVSSLIGDSALAPYISVCYADHHSFVTDWEGTIECSYEVPMISEDLDCGSEINKRIDALFRNYVSGGNSSSVIHGETTYQFYNPMMIDEFLEDRFEDPTILKDLSWEANIYECILSIRIHRNIFNPESLAYMYIDEYDVFNIDLQSGQLMDSQSVLDRLGISREQMMQETTNELDRIFHAGIYMVDEPEEQWEMTVLYNQYSDLLDRGLYLSPQGIQVWAEIISGSKYAGKEMLTLFPDPSSGVTGGSTESALPDNPEDGSSYQAEDETGITWDVDEIIVPFFVMRASEFRQKLYALFEELPDIRDIRDFPYRTYKSFPFVPKFNYMSETPYPEICSFMSGRIAGPDPDVSGAYLYDLNMDLFYPYGSEIMVSRWSDTEECDFYSFSYGESEEAYYIFTCDWGMGNYYYSWIYNAAENTVVIEMYAAMEDCYAYITYDNADGSLVEDNCYISSGESV